ncbi:MAG TPA: ATP-binding protein [Candidatus Limnocylindria bacterium]|jgi:two-component system sensor histidine kinase KdpD|nr:ATP-binding protein [Candidatus Limnocylindria bacterium]
MEAARRLPTWARYGLALAGVAVVTALIAALGRFHLANATMLHLVVVLLAAVALGRGPAVAAAIGAFLSSNFFLVEPRFSLTVANPEEWVTLVLLLLAAIVTGQVAAGQERRAEEAEDHAREARLLYEVAQLMSEPNVGRTLEAVAERLRAELQVMAVRIDVTDPDGLLLAGAAAGRTDALAGMDPGSGSEVLNVEQGRWVRVRPPHGERQATSPHRVLRVPVRGPHGPAGEIVLAAPRDSTLAASAVRLLEALSAQLWTVVDRARLRDEANAAEVLRRADQLKSALLDAVSHDLRTPLASILASSGSLRQRDVEWSEDERRGFAEAIEQEAGRLDRIVGNLLDLSRLESGTLQPDRGWYEPSAMIHEVAARLRPLVAPHRLTLELPDELPPVHVDYSEVDQVLTNLIENAAKYSPPDSEIRVTADVRDGCLHVSVVDDGPGISAEALPRLFEPFFRARGGPRGGSGLGLAVAQGLVEAHGGRIWAENRRQGGATFTFEIPAEEATAPAPNGSAG